MSSGSEPHGSAGRALVTGGTGFTGGFVVERLLDDGWEVAVTSLAGGSRHLPARVAVHTIDLRDVGATRELIHAVRPDLVVHLAAQSSVHRALHDPMGTLHDNAAMQFAVLEAVARRAQHTRVIVAGSADEYGHVSPDENPIGEHQELRPLTAYALSKVAQDLMARQYVHTHGMDIVRTRPFGQLGPRRQPLFVAGNLARQIALIEMGATARVVTVGNLRLQRDFVDVRDAARALVLLARHGTRGAVYNIATGVPHTLREMVDTMIEAARVNVEVIEDAGLLRPWEPEVMVGDATRLRDATGWEPRFSFEHSVLDTLRYWRDEVRREHGAP